MFISSAPTIINWHYTYKCNFSCSHCYSRSPKYPEELSKEIYDIFTDEIINAGVVRTSFGGGEPFIRRDLLNTLRKLGEAGIVTNITTNGWFVTENLAKEIRETETGFVSVSIDGVTKEMHDSIRNQKGSFEKALRAIRILSSYNINTSLSVTLNALNYKQIPEFAKLANDNYATTVNFKIFRPAGNGLLNKKLFDLSKEDRCELLRIFSENKSNSPVEITLYQSGGQANCTCGEILLTLRPNGDLVICPYSNIVVGNLKQNKLSEIWMKSPVLAKHRMLPSECYGERDSEYPVQIKTNGVL